jgi:macrodomain Ter protein organizer (MatP/YcbG family)
MARRNIQEWVDHKLELATTNKFPIEHINDLRFIKAEFQRGKSKTIDDKEAIPILVKLLKSQNELMAQADPESALYKDARRINIQLKSLIPLDILDQVLATEDRLHSWIDEHLDVSKLDNVNKAIGIIKRQLPWVDGNVIKRVVESLK